MLASISAQPQRASELAARVGVTRPTLTSLVDGLAQGGLLRRARVPSDRRGIQLIPTEAGQRALARAEAALTQRLLQLFDRDMTRIAGGIISELGSALDRQAEARIDDSASDQHAAFARAARGR